MVFSRAACWICILLDFFSPRACRMLKYILGDVKRPVESIKTASNTQNCLPEKLWAKIQFELCNTGFFCKIPGKKFIELLQQRNISYPMYFVTRNVLEFTELKNSSSFLSYQHFSFSAK